MNIWFRRLLLILTIGGGFIGLTLTLQSLFGVNKVIGYLAVLLFVALYGYGIFVGLKLSEGPIPIKHLAILLRSPDSFHLITAYCISVFLRLAGDCGDTPVWTVLGLSLGQRVAVFAPRLRPLGVWRQPHRVDHGFCSVFFCDSCIRRNFSSSLTSRCSEPRTVLTPRLRACGRHF
jgi:hypothetical protein